jgi:hypothetical protein
VRHDVEVAKRSPIAEGLLFAVPLRDAGFAVGLVVRVKVPILLGHFYGPARDALPSLDEASAVALDDAVLVARFGHLGLQQRKWTPIGTLPTWDRDRWPTPTFVRYEELSGRTFQVMYDDSDPGRVVSERPIEPGAAEQGPKDGLAGAGFIEIALTNLMRA